MGRNEVDTLTQTATRALDLVGEWSDSAVDQSRVNIPSRRTLQQRAEVLQRLYEANGESMDESFVECWAKFWRDFENKVREEGESIEDMVAVFSHILTCLEYLKNVPDVLAVSLPNGSGNSSLALGDVGV